MLRCNSSSPAALLTPTQSRNPLHTPSPAALPCTHLHVVQARHDGAVGGAGRSTANEGPMRGQVGVQSSQAGHQVSFLGRCLLRGRLDEVPELGQHVQAAADVFVCLVGMGERRVGGVDEEKERGVQRACKQLGEA